MPPQSMNVDSTTTKSGRVSQSVNRLSFKQENKKSSRTKAKSQTQMHLETCLKENEKLKKNNINDILKESILNAFKNRTITQEGINSYFEFFINNIENEEKKNILRTYLRSINYGIQSHNYLLSRRNADELADMFNTVNINKPSTTGGKKSKKLSKKLSKK